MNVASLLGNQEAMLTQSIQVTKPCNEDFSAMTPTQRGAHCEACALEVIDFTGYSPHAIIQELAKSSGRTCGRMTRSQTEMVVASLHSMPALAAPVRGAAASTIMATMLTLGGGSLAAAQSSLEVPTLTEIPVEGNAGMSSPVAQTASKMQGEEGQLSDQLAQSNQVNTTLDYVVLNGTVTVGGIVVQNAQVQFVTRSEVVTAVSRENGTYSLRVPKVMLMDNNVLHVNTSQASTEAYPGRNFYEDQTHTISRGDMDGTLNLEIEHEVVITGIIITTTTISRKPKVLIDGREFPMRHLNEKHMGTAAYKALADMQRIEFTAQEASIILNRRTKRKLIMYVTSNEFTVVNGEPN